MCNEANQTSPQFLYMAFAIDTTDGHGLSNEACHELLKRKGKKQYKQLYITNKAERFSFNSGHAVQIANL